MLIQKNAKITIRDNISTLDENLYFYRNDRNINVLFEIFNFNFEFLDGVKEEGNVVNIINPSYSTIRIIKPSGEQIIIPRCPIQDGLVHFYIDSEFINDIDEIGVYQLQITLYGKNMFNEEEESRVTIPPITFEVLEPIFDDSDVDYSEGIVSQEENSVNRKIISDCNVHNSHASREEIKEGTDLYEWLAGDWITDDRLNSIHYNILKLYNNIEKIDASTINYGINGLATVQDALNTLLSPILEIKFFSTNISTFMEKGIRVNFCNLTWGYSKDTITTQSLRVDGQEIELDGNMVRSYRYSTPFDTNKTFTLTAYDGKDTKSSNITIRFCNRIFWGAAIAPIKYDKTFLDSLTYELSDSRKRTITVQSNTNQYIYYAVPTSFGTCTFAVGGFVGGFEKVGQYSYTNQYNHIEMYDIYKSENPNLGKTTVVIS